MRRPWLPDLTNGAGSLVGLLVGLAALYDLLGIVPGPLMIAVLGLLVSGAPLRRAGKVWLEERREPAEQLPEVTAALELSVMIRELGQGVVMRAVADVAQRRALPARAAISRTETTARGDDRAE